MIRPAETQVELRAPGHSQSGGGGHELGLAIRGKCKASLELALPVPRPQALLPQRPFLVPRLCADWMAPGRTQAWLR